LLPKSFAALSSLCLSPLATFLRAHPGFGRWCFHLLVTGSTSPARWERCPARRHWTVLIQGEGASLLVSRGGKFWLHKGTWKGSGTNLGFPLIRLVRTQIQIQACLRRQKGRLINSPFLGVKLCLPCSGSRVEVLCCVKV
jgi:hypothetical protein